MFKIICWSLSVIALLVLASAHAQNRLVPEGAKPYSPTRLEWLALKMEASQRAEMSQDSDYLMHFIGLETDNTILIYVRYLPTVRRETMYRDIESAKTIIRSIATSYGWVSWLKVREDVKMEELGQTK